MYFFLKRKTKFFIYWVSQLYFRHIKRGNQNFTWPTTLFGPLAAILNFTLEGWLLAKSRKLFFRGGHFWRAKYKKCKKKIQKILLSQIICQVILIIYIPIRPYWACWFHIKSQKRTKIAILALFWLKIDIFVVIWGFYVKPTCSIWPL